MIIPSRLEHQKIRISDNIKKTKKNKTLILCYFHRKCGFLWNRYRVKKNRTAYPQLFLFPFPQTTCHPNPPENVVFCGKCTRYRNTGTLFHTTVKRLKTADCPQEGNRGKKGNTWPRHRHRDHHTPF